MRVMSPPQRVLRVLVHSPPWRARRPATPSRVACTAAGCVAQVRDRLHVVDHFRVRATTGSDVGIVAVGAGAATSGPAQFAQFTARTTTVITAITIVSTGEASFVWQLESCTPD